MLQPRAPLAAGACTAATEGTMYVNNIDHTINRCRNLPVGSATYVWSQVAQEVWTRDPLNPFIYPTETTDPSINPDLNVGIGLINPVGKLIVKGKGTTTGIGLQTQDSAGTPLFTTLDSGNVGVGENNPAGKLIVKGKGTTTGIGLQTQNSSGTPLITTLDNGNVGIGVPAPAQKLDVGGGNSKIRISSDAGGTDGGLIYTGSSIAFGGRTLFLTVKDGLGGVNDEIQIAPLAGSTNGHIQLVAPDINFYTGASQIRLSNGNMNLTGSISTGGSLSVGSDLTVNGAHDLIVGRDAYINGTSIHFGAGAILTSSGGPLTLNGTDFLVNGNITATGTITAPFITTVSDQRLKENILPLTNTLSHLDQLRGVSFEWNDLAASVMGRKKGEKNIGLIAQEVQKVYPELVIPAKYSDGKEFLSVDYMKLSVVLLQAIKELKVEMESFQKFKSEMKSLTELQGEVELLKEKIKNLELK